MSIKSCMQCFEKQVKIDKIEAENLRLKASLARFEKKAKDGYFGSETPSSKKPFKENATAEVKNKNGGAKKGHVGLGRKSYDHNDADQVIHVPLEGKCPNCGGKLQNKGTLNRSIIDLKPPKTEKIIVECEKGYCPSCKTSVKANTDIALPHSQISNSALSHVMNLHYEHGMPLSRVEALLGINHGTLFGSLHRVADILAPMVKALILQYRQEKVRHADETGWRTDGYSGYGWLFCTNRTSIFRFADTRSAKVPEEIFGKNVLDGFLVVDRYAGYNSIKTKRQYCYSHLLRAVEDLEKEFGDVPEVLNFTNALAPLLAQAIKLRALAISDKKFYREAQRIKRKIKKIIKSPSQHLGIKDIQRIFLEKTKHLYHWANDRDVPAENNRAERELRPTVVARKVSFGSQSTRGAKTRSTLMSIWHTVKKRNNGQSVSDWMTTVLGKISIDPKINLASLIPRLHAPPAPTTPEN